MTCKICGGSGIIANPRGDIPKDYFGFIAASPCICTFKKENTMDDITIGSNDIRIGSIVEFIDDTGKYPLRTNGIVEAIHGEVYLVSGHYLEKDDICFDAKQLDAKFYKVAAKRVRILKSLIDRLTRRLIDESIQ